ncbi:MAG: S41 family peptidase, partial [Bacteroidota bacterium]
MNRLVIILLVLFPVITAAQECDCSSNFEWAKQTFEENDAGFSYVIDQKGEEAYAGHTEIFIERVKGVENVAECAEIILEWLGFFRSGHLSIRALNTGDSSAGDQLSDEEIRASFSEWERLEIDVPEFEQYLERKEEHDFEGIWVSEPYKVGIKKMGDKYIGFIIEADGVYWTPGQIKLRIQEDLSTTYYMRDHSARNFEMAELIGNNHLMMGFITFERVRPTLAPQPEIESYFRSIAAQDPYFEQINDQTTLLRIPSFSYSEKSKIDSVILTNKELILQTPNLIIDLRNNGGGSDGSFEELLPILYTNPIRTIGVEMLSTPLNNQRMLDFVNDDDYGFDEEEKKWAQDAYDKLSERIGEFVMLDEFPVSVTRFDTISEF